MSENTMARARRRTGNFFATSAIVIAALVLLSFPVTYFIPLATGSKQFTLLRHLCNDPVISCAGATEAAISRKS
ncbi:MAG: hypothetical protein H7147_07605 [Frankiaceae bacterium]|nr:hypothetical protein [Arenimonas sp.]